jgi:D-proline reductase (dithiol) PrdB
MGLQRAIEMCGIPTVLITLVSEASQQMGPSRAIHPVGFTLGDCTDGPFQKELQRKVVLDALKRWEARIEPGVIWDIEYPDYQRDPLIEGRGEVVRK